MENTVLRLTCKEKMSVAAIHNPAYIPKPGDIIRINDIYLSQPIMADEKRIALIMYEVENIPYTVTYSPIRKETEIDIRVKYIDEISEESLKR